MRGFTLIELIIYITILAGILSLLFNFGWEIIHGDIKSQSIREVQQNSRFVMGKITENILGSIGINNPSDGNSDNFLSLEMEDTDLNPMVFRLSDGRLTITQGGNGPYDLTSSRVVATDLEFINISYENTPGTIKIKMNIEYLNPNNLNQYESSLYTEETVSLRH